MKPYYSRRGVTLYRGEALRVLEELPADSVDALVTDPPYCSGGFTRAEKMRSPVEKYEQHGTRASRPSFEGDNRDSRSWIRWCSIWLSEALRVTRDRGYVLMFTDWRQLPGASDAVQCAGWIWRGLISWDKGPAARAPHKGYFRHQCEYVVWGTRGRARKATHGGPWPGSLSFPVLQKDKFHLTGKPTPLMERLVQCVEPGGTILDPFAGSSTTLLAALKQGRGAIGIELSEANCEIGARRLEAAA